MTQVQFQHFADATHASTWLKAHVFGRLTTDSRQVQAGDGFIAWPGVRHDARAYIRAALDQGAAACLIEGAVKKDKLGQVCDGDINAQAHKIATIANLREQAASIAAAFYEHPSQALSVVGITGTNGKTSSAFWLAQALNHIAAFTNHANWTCGFIGTLGAGVPAKNLENLQDTGLTTPDAVALQSHLSHFVHSGVKACALEASSIGIAQGRLDATALQVAAFTNFSQDHLDYHGDMARYWAQKERLFAWPGLRAVVLNTDDAQGTRLLQTLQQPYSPLALWDIALHKTARLQAKDIGDDGNGLYFRVVEAHTALEQTVQTQIHGRHNVYNLLIALACMRALGVSFATAANALQYLSPVPGRMEGVFGFSGAGQTRVPMVLVDYAHTPDALQQVLLALQPTAQARGGRLWCIFGCGGNRDVSKRPHMGEISEKLADVVVLTSDNPRDENPQNIVDDILVGFTKQPLSLLDRGKAIACAIQGAQDDDVILIAGKGHERYQEVAGTKYPFDDRQWAQSLLQQRQQKQQSPAPTGETL